MSKDAFGLLYDGQPKMLVHQSLENCGSVLELVRLAESKGYKVSFNTDGHFTNDIKINEGFDAGSPMKSHSVRSATRFLNSHPGVH